MCCHSELDLVMNLQVSNAEVNLPFPPVFKGNTDDPQLAMAYLSDLSTF